MASTTPADSLAMAVAEQCAATTRLLALMSTANMSDSQRAAVGTLRQQTAHMMAAAGSVLRAAAQQHSAPPTPTPQPRSTQPSQVTLSGYLGQTSSATKGCPSTVPTPQPSRSPAAAPATAIRRCQGTTVRGTACQITSESYHAAKDPKLREAAKCLADGGQFCKYHQSQERGIGRAPGAPRLVRDDEDNDSVFSVFGGFGDENNDDALGCAADAGGDGETSYRIINDAHLASIQVFRGAGDYGLVCATGNKTPRVPPSTTLPSWVSGGNWLADQNSECRTIKAFNGFIVHKPSDSVVGYVRGQLVHRWDGVVNDCDEYSREMLELLEELFDFRGGPNDDESEDEFGCPLGGDGGDLWFKDHHKRGSKCKWGSALDDGRFAHLDRLEIEPDHRCKSALAALAEPFRLFCAENNVESTFAQVGFIDRPTIDTMVALARNSNGGNVAKLRGSFATMGFRRVGKTDYMAMVTSRAHPCWDPSTHEKPEFPFREVAKTAGDRSMPAILKKCIAARHTSRRTSNEVQQDDACLVDACIALDAIKAHDAERLARPSIVTIDGESRKLCGAALLACLLEATEVWQTHKLARGVRDLHRALNDHVL
jgi:hypothetical protein